MAKKVNNFIKFGKLASIIKKIADENPEIKEQILKESESTSKNNWNKIQNWTSKKLFSVYKEKNISEFTKEKVLNFLDKKSISKKKQICFNIFKIPKADIGQISCFDLENTLISLPKNLQIQIDLSGSSSSFTNTSIKKISELDFLGNGDLTKAIRNMYPDVNDVVFKGLRKKGKDIKDKSNCSYYLKVMFVDDFLTLEEKARQVLVGVNLKDLSQKQKKDRLKRKDDFEEQLRLKRKKLKKIIPPKKVISKTDDEEISKKIDNLKKSTDVLKTEKIKEFNIALKNLKELLKDDIITKEQFRNSFDRLSNNLKKGGLI